MACLFCSWLGLSSAGFSVSLLPAVLCLALHYCLLPLFALLLLAPLRVSKALPLRCLGLLGLFVSMQFAPGCSRIFIGLFSYSFLRCSSCLRCGSLWLCLSAVQALLGFLFPCSLLLGFSAASSLPPFFFFLRCSCCLRCGSLCFPSASASYFIDFVGSTPLPGCAQAYAPLSGPSPTPSVLLSVSG